MVSPQTAVNASAGARTQVSEFVTVAVAVLTALFLAPVLSKLPEASLGAVVFVAAIGLVNPKAFYRLAKSHRAELVISLVTGLAALTLGLLAAVVVGVVLTYVMLLTELGHPNIVELHSVDGRTSWQKAELGETTTSPGLQVLRIEASLYMANIRSTLDRIRSIVESAPVRPKVVVLDLGATPDLGTTVIDELDAFATDMAKDGTELWIAQLSAKALDRLHRMSEWEEWSASGRFHPGLDSAADAFYARVVADGQPVPND